MESLEDLSKAVKALEARVRELEDERQIREVLAHAGYSADCKRDDDYVALWTDDAVYDMASTVSYPDGTSQAVENRYTGKSGLREVIADPDVHHRPGFYGHSLHVGQSNMVSHIQGDSAVVNSYSFLYQEHDGSVALVSAANNQWTLRRVDGAWLLQSRRRRQAGTQAFVDNLDATLAPLEDEPQAPAS
jgi:hypothetical protein